MQHKAFTKILLAIGLAPFFAQASDITKDYSQTVTNGHYIVVLKSPQRYSFMTTPGFNRIQADFVTSQAQQATNELGTQVTKTFHNIIDAFVVKANKQQIQELEKRPNVAFVELDKSVSTMPVSDSVNTNRSRQENADWGLARIVKHNLSDVDGAYDYQFDGNGVTAYVVDTGVNITHSEFGGRASVYVETNGSYQENPQQSADVHWDCNGHGTHVSGTIGGKTYGVAKQVSIVGVSVLNCKGSGSDSQVIAGLEEVLKLAQKSGKPSVVNMSLGGGKSKALDQAVDKLVAANIPVVVAAGNRTKAFFDSYNACNVSPASNKNAITVGATDINDNRAGYSYFGKCTDIFAPGTRIKSAWIGSDDATNTISGTSMATPHVAGVIALYLQENPNRTPQELKNELRDRSTTDAIDMNVNWWSLPYMKSLAKSSPNNLLYAFAD